MRWVIAMVLLGGAAWAPAPAAAAAGSCPDGFHLHAVGDGQHRDGEHQHVGLSMERVDRNDTGFFCVKHTGADGRIHVHIDDLLPPTP